MKSNNRISQKLKIGQCQKLSKEIENLTNNLPSKLLLKYANTQYLLDVWFQEKEFAIQFGKLLKARFGGGGGNPAFTAWQAGEINEFDYKCLSLLIDFYDSLFGLIQSSWHFIAGELQQLSTQVTTNYPKSETQYFLFLIQEEFNSHYKKNVNGYVFKIKDFESESKTLRDVCWKPNLSSQDLAILKLQHNRHKKELPTTFYLQFALITATTYSQVDSTLSDKLIELNRYLARLADLMASACRQERKPNPPKSLISHKVDKGEFFIGARGAGWKRM